MEPTNDQLLTKRKHIEESDIISPREQVMTMNVIANDNQNEKETEDLGGIDPNNNDNDNDNDNEGGGNKEDNGGDKLSNSEIDNLRVCIQGIDPFSDEKDLFKFCKNNFNPPILLTGVAKKKRQAFAFLAFSNIQDKERFEKEAIGMKIKNKKVKIRPVYIHSKALKFEKKAKNIEDHINNPKPKIIASEEAIKEEMSVPLWKKVCPLKDIDYNTQIKTKRDELTSILKDIKTKVKQQIAISSDKSHALPKWLRNDNIEETAGPLKELIEANPEYRYHYRNKTEFTIGYSYDMPNEPKVGFNKGNFTKGFMYVESPDDCPIITKEALDLAKILQEYIKISSFKPYHKITHEGFWKNFVVRQSQNTKEMLLQVVGAKALLTLEEYTKLKDDLIQIFTNPERKLLYKESGYNIVGIIFQTHDTHSDNIPYDSPYEIIYGNQDYYLEEIMGYKFRVSFTAFLQINPGQCEKLYKLIESLAQINDQTVFLDICCGIGTIGICAASKAKKIIGIEMIQKAIDDANYNAKLNGLQNIEYHSAKVEQVISDIVKAHAGKNKIVAVVDPPRAGLHKDVITALRRCRGLDHLIYVSCNPDLIMNNMLDLCLPEDKRRKAPSFTIIEAYGVDLFPQTAHYEAVFNMKRLYDEMY